MKLNGAMRPRPSASVVWFDERGSFGGMLETGVGGHIASLPEPQSHHPTRSEIQRCDLKFLALKQRVARD
eukprot:CAMPEP_0118972624 /NCGR_PEP_ID=MMETSP1173-20130426/8885_1 /TAXON_ID=1034831 /ORGANISM="Rhizochromulina marina cf, Strain CCMP1243" /LENGTH=69 /DNA_ID=CAMNT_0006922187 /DNA_START=103 /DNA_END=309 /DNA_ORIENTATION=-